MKKILTILGVAILLVVLGRLAWAFYQVTNENPNQIKVDSSISGESVGSRNPPALP